MHERNPQGGAWNLQFIATKSAIVESHHYAENDKHFIELYGRIFSYVVTGVPENILLSSTLCPEDGVTITIFFFALIHSSLTQNQSLLTFWHPNFTFKF